MSKSVDCFGVLWAFRVAMLMLLFLSLPRGSVSVDGLDDLEGQAHQWYFLAGTVLVVLPGPDQLDLGHAPHAGWRIRHMVVGFFRSLWTFFITHGFISFDDVFL
jgi:hypothetical protein